MLLDALNTVSTVSGLPTAAREGTGRPEHGKEDLRYARVRLALNVLTTRRLVQSAYH